MNRDVACSGCHASGTHLARLRKFASSLLMRLSQKTGRLNSDLFPLYSRTSLVQARNAMRAECVSYLELQLAIAEREMAERSIRMPMQVSRILVIL